MLSSLGFKVNDFLGFFVYFLTSFLKVHAGSIYPSDVITCIPIIAIN